MIDAQSKEGLAGVSVQIKGTNQGTTSDAGGNFTLSAEANAVLVFSFIGYVPQEVPLNGQNTLRISLKEDNNLLETVLVVGSRNANRTELNTPVPIDVIAVRDLQKVVPQYDINQILTYVAPSFQSNRQSSSDGTEHIEPASLRGLGPDQTLVLINGKRRHTTSLLNNQGTFGNGSVGTDLNAIPLGAIERIEVLRDGASAQYGSDAIAGVINVVLKRTTRQLDIHATTGITSRGDGEVVSLSANYGIPLN
ncbi:MAG: hypothetical protein OHK0053_19070 [Microscillaceae bacterium]